MSIGDFAARLRNNIAGGEEMDEPQGGDAPEPFSCDVCGAIEFPSTGKPFTPLTLGLHKFQQHGIKGQDRGQGGRDRGRARRGAGPPGRPRRDAAPKTPRERPKAGQAPPSLSEIRGALDQLHDTLEEYDFPQTAAELALVSGGIEQGLSWIAKKNPLAASAVRVIVAAIGCGFAIFGLGRVARIFQAELAQHRARRTSDAQEVDPYAQVPS